MPSRRSRQGHQYRQGHRQMTCRGSTKMIPSRSLHLLDRAYFRLPRRTVLQPSNPDQLHQCRVDRAQEFAGAIPRALCLVPGTTDNAVWTNWVRAYRMWSGLSTMMTTGTTLATWIRTTIHRRWMRKYYSSKETLQEVWIAMNDDLCWHNSTAAQFLPRRSSAGLVRLGGTQLRSGHPFTRMPGRARPRRDP